MSNLVQDVPPLILRWSIPDGRMAGKREGGIVWIYWIGP